MIHFIIIHLDSTKELTLLNRIHNSKVDQSCLVQLVQTVNIIEAVEGEDGEVLGHINGGQ